MTTPTESNEKKNKNKNKIKSQMITDYKDNNNQHLQNGNHKIPQNNTVIFSCANGIYIRK